ncbi:hypothetical protein MPTK1_7g08190 [Marchantia polymorpha subsp. ruderalis]|uniref:Uncharacterized protein n=2 Tax=Marchantia polymorpha TaxID=3197 RepID=A0AAF6BXB6_MARPO|nr:hypothetical protein MARPO_0146s0019 [Marchantia polymorpha]BBN16650.1 hypothetical protein Mp_7g08190 [Marchantia polymorpha subsp. ruderalis]|eukprot:PTQ29197.1 hypothetical protein MARPO_0146s0019 [Marchantia polymorpha]
MPQIPPLLLPLSFHFPSAASLLDWTRLRRTTRKTERRQRGPKERARKLSLRRAGWQKMRLREEREEDSFRVMRCWPSDPDYHDDGKKLCSSSSSCCWCTRFPVARKNFPTFRLRLFMCAQRQTKKERF